MKWQITIGLLIFLLFLFSPVWQVRSVFLDWQFILFTGLYLWIVFLKPHYYWLLILFMEAHFFLLSRQITQMSPSASLPVVSPIYLRANLGLYLMPFLDYPVLILGQPVMVLNPLLGTLVAGSIVGNLFLNPQALGWINFLLVSFSLFSASLFIQIDYRHLLFLLPIFYISVGMFVFGLRKHLATKPYWRLVYWAVVLLMGASLVVSLK